jgi:hypothetical protein
MLANQRNSRKTGPPRCTRWKKSMVTFYPQYLGVLNMKLGRRLTITKSSLSSCKQFLKLLAQSCNKNWFHIREWRTKLDEFGSSTSGLDAGPIPPSSSNTDRLIINLHGTSHLGAQCQDLQQVKAILTTLVIPNYSHHHAHPSSCHFGAVKFYNCCCYTGI